MIADDYKALEPDNRHRQAKLIHVPEGWRDGTGDNDKYKQYLGIDYYRGEETCTDKIGHTVAIARDRPLPRVRVQHVPTANTAKLTLHTSTAALQRGNTERQQTRDRKGHAERILGSLS